MAFPIRKGVARSLRCVVAAILCVVALAVPARAFADTPAIAYDGNARQLTVSGATMSSGEPDLFPAFKDLRPGDEREQQIEIRATGVKSQVRVFVRAVVDHETTHLLSPITLTAAVSDASADWLQAGTPGSVFAHPTQVATFTSDGSTVLNLQLSVPTSVGNELADAKQDHSLGNHCRGRWRNNSCAAPLAPKSPACLAWRDGRQLARSAFDAANASDYRFYGRAVLVSKE